MYIYSIYYSTYITQCSNKKLNAKLDTFKGMSFTMNLFLYQNDIDIM